MPPRSETLAAHASAEHDRVQPRAPKRSQHTVQVRMAWVDAADTVKSGTAEVVSTASAAGRLIRR